MGIRRINFTEEESNSLKRIIALYGEKNDMLNKMQDEANEILENIEKIKAEIKDLLKEESELIDSLNKKYEGITLAEIRFSLNPKLPY